MKKRVLENPKKNSNLKLLLIIVAIIVLLVAVFLIFKSSDLSLSPYESIDIETAVGLIDAIGDQCAKIALGVSTGTCQDARGNIYDYQAFQTLRELIGEANLEALKDNYELDVSATPFASSSPKPSASVSSSPTTSSSSTSSPKPSASTSASASASSSPR